MLDYQIKEYKPFLRPWIHISDSFQEDSINLYYPQPCGETELRTVRNPSWTGSSQRGEHSIFWWIIYLLGLFSLMEKLHTHPSPLSPLPDPAWNQLKESPMRASAVGRISVLLRAKTPGILGRRPPSLCPAPATWKCFSFSGSHIKADSNSFQWTENLQISWMSHSFMTDGSLRTGHRDRKP